MSMTHHSCLSEAFKREVIILKLVQHRMKSVWNVSNQDSRSWCNEYWFVNKNDNVFYPRCTDHNYYILPHCTHTQITTKTNQLFYSRIKTPVRAAVTYVTSHILLGLDGGYCSTSQERQSVPLLRFSISPPLYLSDPPHNREGQDVLSRCAINTLKFELHTNWICRSLFTLEMLCSFLPRSTGWRRKSGRKRKTE
jgi:hypothetical protein